MPNSADIKAISHFIYETGILSRTPRSGLWFLGTGQQSVAEHILHTAFIGYALAYLTPDAWWLNVNDPWFVDRKEKDRKWRTPKK